jgi:hypothetical protein
MNLINDLIKRFRLDDLAPTYKTDKKRLDIEAKRINRYFVYLNSNTVKYKRKNYSLEYLIKEDRLLIAFLLLFHSRNKQTKGKVIKFLEKQNKDKTYHFFLALVLSTVLDDVYTTNDIALFLKKHDIIFDKNNLRAGLKELGNTNIVFYSKNSDKTNFLYNEDFC